MTLHQLKIFAAVAKLKSFTRVAENLRLSQPSVSLLIQSLQRELGVKLFEKLGNKVHLTEAGRRLLQLVDSALLIIDKIPEEMDEVKGLKKGRLAVGGSGFAGATVLPVAVQEFKKAFPSIEVKLMIQPSPILEEKLLNGELDVALLGLASKSPLLIAKPYREEEIVAIASPSHPLTRRRSVPLSLVAQEAIVADEKGGQVREMIENIFARERLPFTPALEINAHFGGKDPIKTAVANGLGIAFVTKHHVALDVKAGRLKILKISDFKLKRVMYLVVHKRRPNPATEVFVNFLRNYKAR